MYPCLGCEEPIVIVVDRVLISAAPYLRATIEFSAGADDIALSCK